MGSTLSGGWPDRRPPVRTTPQIGPDHPPNRAGPPHKSGRTTPPIGPARPTNRAGPPPQSGRTAPQIGPATRPDHLEIGPDHRPKVVRPTWPRWLGQRVRTVFCGSGPFFAGRTAVRTVFCGSGPNGRPSARWPATPKIGPDQPPNRAGRPSGPPPESGRPGGRTGVRTPAPTTLWNARAARNRAHRGLFCPFFLRGA